MSQFIYQQKQAWASLKKKPGFVTTILLTMGLTLGALLCIITLNYLLLAKPLPYPDQDSLYVVEHGISDKSGDTNAKSYTFPGLMHLYKHQTAFSTGALLSFNEDVLTSNNSQPTVKITNASPEIFDMLAVPMALGRPLEETEAVNAFNPVAVISFATWQTLFNGSQDILDQKVSLSGVSYRIVGVTAQHFIEPQLSEELGRNTHIWLPWDYELLSKRFKESWGNIHGRLSFVGKITPGLSASQAEQILTPLVNDTWQEAVADIDFFNGWSINMELTTFKSYILGDSESIGLMLLAGVVGLVLIAVANISNLFMSRTAEQQRQMAIHAAVGATKHHLFKSMLAETSLLMGLSTLLALVIAAGGFYILQSYLDTVLPRVNELSINALTLIAAIIISTIFALFFAKLSSNMLNYRALNSILQSSGKGTGIQVSKKTRQVLITSQVALATVLVFANISLFNDALKTIQTPIGFSTDNIANLTLSISATPETSPPREEISPVMTEFKQQLAQLPEVEMVSHSRSPLSGYNIWAMTALDTGVHYTPNSKSIDHQYFQMIQQPLLEGDYFSQADFLDRNRKMIINEHFAKLLAPEGNALGLQISTGDDDNPYTVTGVVKAIQMPGSTKDTPRAYVPGSTAGFGLMVKFKPGQTLSREQIATLVSGIDKRYSVFEYDQTSNMHMQALFSQITTAATTAVLTLLVFFLAGIGLYGILSYSTQLRRFELGTRMAIGAKRKDLVMLIVKDNSVSVLWGFVASAVLVLVGYLAFTDALDSYVNLALLPALAMTLALIVSITLIACYWPLRQFINKPAIHTLRGSE